MTIKDSKRYLPAEGEYNSAVLLSWPHENTDWNPKLKEVTDFYVRLTTLLLGKGTDVLIVCPDSERVKRELSIVDIQGLHFFECETNDTWTRDFGPITIMGDGEWHLCDFKFNGWGLKFPSCYDNLVTSKLYKNGVLKGIYENHLGFVLEGGSIESDGCGTIMTTSNCLLSPNRNGDLSKEQIEERLKRELGAKKILWLNHGELAGDDTDSHIDTLARFGVKNRLIYTVCSDKNDQHYEELKRMENEILEFTNKDGKPYQLFTLPLPDAIYDENGCRLPATYANFLVLPNYIIVPSYRQEEKDNQAKNILENAYERPVYKIDSSILITQHGSLHCVTMQLPSSLLT